jgi:hypothetical protein
MDCESILRGDKAQLTFEDTLEICQLSSEVDFKLSRLKQSHVNS